VPTRTNGPFLREKPDGRWHTAARGKRIVYFRRILPWALIEVLANLKGNPKFFPDAYQLMKIKAADGVSTEALAPEILPGGCRDDLTLTKSYGDAWLTGRLRVIRSAICSRA